MNQKQIIRASKRLARRECACGRDGYCVVQGMPCSIGNPNRAFDCRYFMESVLPGDAALCSAVTELMNKPLIDQPTNRTCERCGAPLVPSINRQHYFLT